jgi:2,3-bisphosphoglycerate-dependent phosphoglycerate mutase
MIDTKFKRIKKNLKVPRVILLRHGHTDLNGVSGKSEDRIRGWIDVPLNAEGRKDAEKAREQLKGQNVDGMFSSDLIRARETADIVNKDKHVPIINSAALRPWNLGEYQGKPTDQVIDKINSHINDPDDRVPDGETFNEFRERYIGLLDRIIRQAIQEKQTILVATHLRNLKLADGWVQNGFPRDHSVDPDVVSSDEFDPGEIYEIPIPEYRKARK